MKFKERFLKFKKEVINQYDIYEGLGHKNFEYRDFKIIFPNVIKPKGIFSTFVFENRDLLIEYLFFHYKTNFYPKPGGWLKSYNNGSKYDNFVKVKNNIASLMEDKKKSILRF